MRRAYVPVRPGWTHTLRMLALLTCAFALAAWLARAALARPSAPADVSLSAFGFDSCALPCWSGIEVGRTPFIRASELIASTLRGISHQIMVSGSQIAVIAQHGDRQMSAQVHYNGGLVGSLRLRVELRLIDLIDRLGLPDCARAYSTVALTWLFPRNHDAVIVTALVDRPAVDGGLSELWIASSYGTCSEIDSLDWRGFAPNWVYTAMR